MKLYLIFQTINNGYDSYDSAVVAAKNEYEAVRIHPSDHTDEYDDERNCWYWTDERGERHYTKYDGDWVRSIRDVKVRYIGEAAPDVFRGVVCSSFNAG